MRVGRVIAVACWAWLAIPPGGPVAARLLRQHPALAVKQFRAHVSVVTEFGASATIEGNTYTSSIKRRMTAEVLLVRESNPASWNAPGARMRVEIDETSSIKGDGTNMEGYVRGTGESEGGVALYIDEANGVYHLSAAGAAIMVRNYSSRTLRPLPTSITDQELSRTHGDFSFKDLPLPPGTTSLSGTRVIEHPSRFIGDPMRPIRTTVEWSLVPDGTEELELVLSSREWDAWIPRDGNEIAITATLRRRGGGAPSTKASSIRFELTDVSSESGVCLNWPAEGRSEPDLKIAVDRNPALGVHSSGMMAGARDVTEATVIVSSLDYGAWGRLRATAQVPGFADVVGRWSDTRDSVSLPKDEDSNRVADAWTEQYGGFGESSSWDNDAEPEGQYGSGDGVSLYEEYRGVFDASRSHVRTDPNRRTLFVIDDGALFDGATWHMAAGMESIRLLSDLVMGGQDRRVSRIVDRNDGQGSIGSIFALRLMKMPGMVDPIDKSDTNVLGRAVPETGDTPVTIDYVLVFPDRIRKFVDVDMRAALERAITDPSTGAGRAVTEAAGLPRSLAERALASFNDSSNVARVAQALVNRTVVHELGHGVGMHHHPDGSAAPDEEQRACPSRYFGPRDNAQIYVLEILFPQQGAMSVHTGAFCRAQARCWRNLTTKRR